MNTDEFSRVKSLYQLAIETRNFEITQLVQRNNFFMIFQGVLLAGLMQASGGSPIPIVSFLVCGCGIGISLLQTGMAAGAKFWQERWETEAEEKEKYLLEMLKEANINVGRDFWKLFSLDSSASRTIVETKQNSGLAGFLIRKKFSVSKIPIYVGIVFSVFWSLLMLSTIQTPLGISPPSLIVGYKLGQNKPSQDDEKDKKLVCNSGTLDGKNIILCR